MAVKGAHQYVDFIQPMAYNPYINPDKPGDMMRITCAIHCAHVLYSFTVHIHCTHTLYSYTVLIHCTHTGTEWPKPAKCDASSVDPKPYDAFGDFERYATVLGVPKAKLILGMMPGCSDHNRCTSAADLVKRTQSVVSGGWCHDLGRRP
jgi:hypothetical protein